MTDDDKALVERLRGDWPEILVEKHWMMDSDAIDKQREEAADRIEQLEREKAVVSDLWEQQKEISLDYLTDCNKAAERIEALEAENERLREAGAKMSKYAGHDDDCQIMMKGVWGDKTPCDCGYEDAWKALRDALGETK